MGRLENNRGSTVFFLKSDWNILNKVGIIIELIGLKSGNESFVFGKSLTNFFVSLRTL